MILNGRLGPFSVVDVLQFLSLSKATGKLVLDAGRARARVYFHDGVLVYARREGPTERLGERLLRLGLVTPAQIAGADLRSELNTERKRIGQILVEAGSLDQATLQKVVRDQILECVYGLLALDDGEFRFFHGVLPDGEDILLDISLDLLLLEGLKKIDELRQQDDSGQPPPG
mgnify:CR=1 FL=1